MNEERTELAQTPLRRARWWRTRIDLAPLAVAVAVVAYVGTALMPRERARILDDWQRRLDARSEEIVFDLQRYLNHEVAETALVILLAEASHSGSLASADGHPPNIVPLLTRGAEMHGWTSAFVFDRAGHALAAGGPEAEEVDRCWEVAKHALIAGSPSIDLIAGAHGPRVVFATTLDLGTKAASASPGVMGVAVIAMPAEFELYPLLTRRAQGVGDFDSLLLRNLDGRWQRLSPMAERREAAASFRIADWPGDQRVGPGSFQTLTDDRGAPIRTSVLPVKRTPWLVVVAVPEAEVAAGVRDHLAMIGLESLLLTLALGIGSLGLWHRRRAQMEANLRGIRSRYDTLFEQANDAILVLSPDGRVLEANCRAEELYGRSRADLLRLSLADLTGPQGCGNGDPSRCVAGAGGMLRECEHRGADGSAIAVEISSRRLHLDREEVTVAIVRDVRAQKEQQAQLLAAARQYRVLFESNPHPMWVADVETLKILEVNDAAIGHYGWSREEWLRLTVPEFHPAEDVPDLLKTIGRRPSDSYHAGVWRHRTKDGRTIHVDVSTHATQFAGRAARLVLANDVTERVRAEERMRLFERAIEQSPVSIVITDPVGVIEYVNPTFTRVAGYATSEAVGQEATILKSDRHPREFYQELLDTLQAGKEWRGELHSRRKNGDPFWESAVIAPVTAADGAIRHFVAVKEDITEHKRLEEQYRQAQKMEAVGRLAGGVAHDFNNLLTVISGFTQLSLVGLPEGDRRTAHLKEVERAAERASSLTRQLLAFSRKQILQPQVLNLNEAIAGIEKMLRRLLGEDIEVKVHRGADLGLVLADPGQIEQVLLNLAVNARDAMPGGGRLTIETGNQVLDEAYVKAHPGARPGPQVMVAVTDTGTGMTDEVKAHLFEPFFTTKGIGKGTGLGLATIYGIVKQTGGAIFAYSELGKGSTFKVYLPRAEAPGPVAAPPAKEGPNRGGTETILVAEDEESVARIAVSVLAEAGYAVMRAPDGEAAADLAARHSGPLHLLLTDLVMPRLGGLDLADRLRGPRPMLRVLYMSGYASRASGESGMLPPGAAFLQKPFAPRTLLAKVRAVLDGTSGSAEGQA